MPLKRGQVEINLDGGTTQLGAGAAAQMRRQSQARFGVAGMIGRTGRAAGRIGGAFAPFWAKVQREVDARAIDEEEARLAETPSARGLVEINADYIDPEGRAQKVIIRDDRGVLPPELPDKRPWFGVQSKAFYDLQVSKYATEAIADSERHILQLAQESPNNPETFSMKAAAYRGAMTSQVHPAVRGAVDAAIQEASQSHFNRISNDRHQQERASYKAQWATEHQRKVGDISNYFAANGWAHESQTNEDGTKSARLVPEVGGLVKKVTDHIQLGINAGIITQTDAKGIIEDMQRQVSHQAIYGALKQFGARTAGEAGMEAVLKQVQEGKFLVPKLHYDRGTAGVSFVTYDQITPDPEGRVAIANKLRQMWTGATQAQRVWLEHDQQVKNDAFNTALIDSMLAGAEGRPLPNLRALAKQYATDPADHAAKMRSVLAVERAARIYSNQFNSRMVANLRAEGLRERYFEVLDKVGRDGMGFFGTEYFTDHIASLDESDLGQALQLFGDAVQHGEDILRAQFKAAKQMAPVMDRQQAFTSNRYVGPSKPTQREHVEPRFENVAREAGVEYAWETMPIGLGLQMITSPLGSTLPQSFFTYLSGSISMAAKREEGVSELTKAVQYFRTVRDDPRLQPQLAALDEKTFAAMSYLQKYGVMQGNVADPDLITRAREIQLGQAKGSRYNELSREERDELWGEINDVLDDHKHAPKRLKTAIAELATTKLGLTDNDSEDAVDLAWTQIQKSGFFGVSSIAVDPVSQQHLNPSASSYLAPWSPDVVYGDMISTVEIVDRSNMILDRVPVRGDAPYRLGVNAWTQYGRVDPANGHLVYHVRVLDRRPDGQAYSRILEDDNGAIELTIGEWAYEASSRNLAASKLLSEYENVQLENKLHAMRAVPGVGISSFVTAIEPDESQTLRREFWSRYMSNLERDRKETAGFLPPVGFPVDVGVASDERWEGLYRWFRNNFYAPSKFELPY